MPTEAQPTEATSVLPSAMLVHEKHTKALGSGLTKTAREILQTQLEEIRKIKRNSTKSRCRRKQTRRRGLQRTADQCTVSVVVTQWRKNATWRRQGMSQATRALRCSRTHPQGDTRLSPQPQFATTRGMFTPYGRERLKGQKFTTRTVQEP